MGSYLFPEDALTRPKTRSPFSAAAVDPSIEEEARAELAGGGARANRAPAATYGYTSAPARVRTYGPASDGASAGGNSALRTGFEALTSPLRALTGVTGTILAQPLRLLDPGTYDEARAELEADEANHAGPGFLKSAAALPGVGDVLSQHIDQNSTFGRIARPVARLAGNILGDPTTYVGVGLLGRVTKAGRAVEGLARAQRLEQALTEAGQLDRAAKIAARIPQLAGRVAATSGAETPFARGAQAILNRVERLGTAGSSGEAAKAVGTAPSFAAGARGLGRFGLTLPFGPIPAVAYAPDLVEGVINSSQDAYREARAGRYSNAAASGAGALLSAGLGLLVARGLITEAEAAGVLEGHLARQMGETGTAVDTESAPPVNDRAAMEAAIEAEPEAAATALEAPPPTPGAAPAPPPAAIAPTPAAPPPPRAPHERSGAIRIAVDDQKIGALHALMDQRREQGKSLTKADLEAGGFASKKQLKEYGVQAVLDRYHTDLWDRLEATSGGGYKVREAEVAPGAAPAVAPAVAPASAPAASAPADLPVSPAEAGGKAAPTEPVEDRVPPTEAPAAAAGVSSEEGPTLPPVESPVKRTPVSRAELDRNLGDEGTRAMVGSMLDSIGRERGKATLDLTRDDVRALYPGEENATTRAGLNRALYAMKKVAGAGEGSASLSDEARAAYLANRGQALGGLREPSGIGGRAEAVSEPEPHLIASRDQLDDARHDLDALRADIDRGAEPGAGVDASERARMDRRARELEDEIRSAIDRGIGTPEMAPAPRAAKPEYPGYPEARVVPYGERDNTPAEPAVARQPVRLSQPTPIFPAEHDTGPGATHRALSRFVSTLKMDVPGKKAPSLLDRVAHFRERASEIIGKPFEDATHDEQNLVYTMARRNPEAFGAPEPRTQLTGSVIEKAARRLMGEGEHMGRLREAAGERARLEFKYEPGTPAAAAQEKARTIEAATGAPLEDDLQRVLTRRLAQLNEDPGRHEANLRADVESLVDRRMKKAAELRAAGKGEEADALLQRAFARNNADIGESEIEALERKSQKRAATEKNWRRLLVDEADDTKARAELTKLLVREVGQRRRDFVTKSAASKSESVDSLMARGVDIADRASEGLDEAERARFSIDSTAFGEAIAAREGAQFEIKYPPRPEGVDPKAWVEKVRADPDTLRQYQGSLLRLKQDWEAGKGTRTGVAGESAPGVAAARSMADALGIKVDPRRGVGQLFDSLYRRLAPGKKTSASSELLTDALVRSRGESWAKAVERGAPVGDGGARVVDLEGDARDLVQPLAKGATNTADALTHVTHELAQTVGLPTRFGGFAPSPQLNAVRIGDDAFINPLHARHRAEAELADRGLEGGAYTDALDYTTARNIIDEILHEIAHLEARRHAADGDSDFITAYKNAILDAREVYSSSIERVQDALGKDRVAFDELMPTYKSAVDSLQPLRNRRAAALFGKGVASGEKVAKGPGGFSHEQPVRVEWPDGTVHYDAIRGLNQGHAMARAESNWEGARVTATTQAELDKAIAAEKRGETYVGLDTSDATRSGARRIAPIPNRPGGDQGNPPLGGLNGRGPGGAVSGSLAEPAAGVRGAAAAGEGAAGGLRPGQRLGGGIGDGAGERATDGRRAEAGSTTPAASLTGNAKAALDNARTNRVFNDIQKLFAVNYAKYAGRPEDADAVVRELEAVRNLSPEAKEALRKSAPNHSPIGININKLDGLTDEEKESIAFAAYIRNHTFSRAEPMKYEDVDASMRNLLDVHTPEEFVSRSEKLGLKSPADFALLRTIHLTFEKEKSSALARMRAAMVSGNTAEAEKAKEALAWASVRSNAALQTLIPETTNVARILAFQRMMVHPLAPDESFRARFLGAMRAARVKTEKGEELYSMLSDTLAQGPAGNWTNFTNAFRDATKVKFFDKFLEFWKAGLLGWPSQIANVTSNLLFRGLRDVEHSTSILTSHYFPGLAGKQGKRYVGEIGARMHGTRMGLAEAWSTLKSDLGDIARLHPPDIARRLREGSFYDEPDVRQLYGAIGGKKGEFVRIPFKLLDAFDNFFKHLSRSQEYSAHAFRLANDSKWRTGGESAEHAQARILSEIRRAASAPVTEYALFRKYNHERAGNVFDSVRKASLADTFQSPLNDAMKKIYQASQAHPATQLLVPFFKTPYNILGEGMKRTPLGALWSINEYRKGNIDDPRFVEAMVKSAIGSVVMTTMAQAAMSGAITGGGPADPKERELLKRTGWQPYSFKAGDQYVSFSRLEPMSTVMGLGADIGEAWKAKDIDTGSQLLQKGVASITGLTLDKSFISGLDAGLKILTDPQREGLTAIRQLQSGLIPNTVGMVPVGHLARATDDTYRESEAFTGSPFLTQIPGLSQTLEPQRGPTGEVRERKGTAFERMFSPFARSPVQDDDIGNAAGEIARVGVGVEAPPTYYRVGHERVYYSPEEREAIAEAQETAMRKVARIIDSSAYQGLPDDETVAVAGRKTKRDLIVEIINRYRRPAVERANRTALARAR